MALSTTRLAKVAFCLCIAITICSLAVRIYISDIHILTVRTSYNLPGTASSTSSPKSNFLQRILHSAVRPLSPGGGDVLDTSPASRNRTLLAIEKFSKSQPPNSSYGDEFYNEIVERARLCEAQSCPKERNYLVDSQFLNYLKCPTTVRTKLLQHGFSVKKFLPEVPMLMFNEHYSRSEYQRLSKFVGINGWQDMDENDISETLWSLKSPNNRYLFDDRLVDGHVPNNVGCIRCAVIGNGGILRGSGKGQEIDAHDYVFRVNVALTKGYEADVGAKTSFYCFTMVTLSNSLRGGSQFGFRTPPYHKGIRYVFFADNDWTYQYLGAVLNNRAAPRSADRFKRTPPVFPKGLAAEDIKLIHPDFQRYLRYSWVNSTSQHKTVHRPTTGAIMLLLALHTCDEVNVYGFAGSYTEYSEHYYDKKFQKHIFFANHDNNAENALWRQLHRLGIINLYTRR